MSELPYLFVYGTLRTAGGTEWSRFLTAASRFVGSGRAHGALFHLDGYPGMTVCTDDDAWVTGEVCLLNDPSSALPFLDAYEGCGPSDPLPHEFERQAVTVLLDSGQAVEAWAYIYALETQGKARITSGDYLQARHRGRRPTRASPPS
jgi:gamma-glutamylcyclotransferase (GGCT)/AIG2-like uncharacterized protein YtfP